MVVGLANGSRSANKSIQADAFLSLIFDLLVAPFLYGSDDVDDEDDDAAAAAAVVDEL